MLGDHKMVRRNAKHWCFTLNNYTEDDERLFQAIGTERIGIDYFVYAKETGENGTPHLQCHVSFSCRRSLRFVKDLFGDRLHAEVCRGTPAQSAEYCKKDGAYEEFGSCPRGSGKRSDLDAVVACIKAGISKSDLIEEHASTYARSFKFVNECFLRYSRSRDWMPETVVYFGETGLGKTRKAFEEAEAVPYMHSGGMWFDGYDGEAEVIFDDFGGSEFKLTYLLKLLDRYPMRVPVKGGFVNWVPRKIWITSNYDPKEWFPNAKDEHVKALFRRFHKVVRFRRMASVVSDANDDHEELIF